MSEYPISQLNKVVRGPKRADYDVESIYKILDDAFLCHVGYVWQNKAIVIPTAYARQDDKIYIHGSLKNRMMLSLLEAGEASISVTHLDGLVLARSAFHHSANYRSVNVFGKVKKIEDPNEKMNALKYILNHMVPGHWDNVRQPNDKEFHATLVLEICIETASAKVRAEGVNDEAEDHKSPIWAGVVPIKQVAYNAISDEDLKEGVQIPEAVLKYVEKNSH
ncbi:pyridoxamine 5'-phosphate oxidase family protein [Aquimarina sp. 2201CG5-10]|uniref:pyridoxamine 5'-phosphate oxidase family protein n=1 Tax=Aquimarina callyspongiae TaxID=3098150 RepID=UPI002AB4E4B6|nr:pyridoxamine 5'-phosphate oxidase family protein [Aquimarina sp. 2201CG5-10]MDY8135700.1 pyridoxamine 5'-phosphate oxidase family protein [Aquimarina sp. 2201CG5-10]